MRNLAFRPPPPPFTRNLCPPFKVSRRQHFEKIIFALKFGTDLSPQNHNEIREKSQKSAHPAIRQYELTITHTVYESFFSIRSCVGSRFLLHNDVTVYLVIGIRNHCI